MLAFIVSGVYNSIRLFPQYKANPPMLHSLWGTHILLALVIFGISIYLLKGVEPPRNHRSWMKVNVGLMLVVILVASSLKWAREHENPRMAPTKTPPAIPNATP
jgi:heme A synthase